MNDKALVVNITIMIIEAIMSTEVATGLTHTEATITVLNMAIIIESRVGSNSSTMVMRGVLMSGLQIGMNRLYDITFLSALLLIVISSCSSTFQAVGSRCCENRRIIS